MTNKRKSRNCLRGNTFAKNIKTDICLVSAKCAEKYMDIIENPNSTPEEFFTAWNYFMGTKEVRKLGGQLIDTCAGNALHYRILMM